MSDEVLKKIEEFFAAYPTRQYKEGQILILSGETSDYVYQITKGKVKVYDVSYRGDEVILNVFKAPAFFPMSQAINKSDNPYIFEAETDIVVHRAPSDAAVKFIKDNPDVMLDLLSRLYRGLDGMMSRMVQLMSGNAKNRLARELIIEAERFGKKIDEQNYALSLSEGDLSARAGLTRETVNREVSKLKKAGLLEIRSGDILIKDLKALKSSLEQEA